MTSTRGFSPGIGQPGVFNPFCGIDAADTLLPAAPEDDLVASGRGVLLLADGSRFEGELFGLQSLVKVNLFSLRE